MALEGCWRIICSPKNADDLGENINSDVLLFDATSVCLPDLFLRSFSLFSDIQVSVFLHMMLPNTCYYQTCRREKNSKGIPSNGIN